MLPTPAMPANSVTRAPTLVTSRMLTENTAHPRPNRALISSAWPLPVMSPSLTVSSMMM